MGREYFIGIDIGGTSVKLAFVHLDGKIHKKWILNTDISNNGMHIVPQMVMSIEGKLVEEKIDKGQILGVGIGAPGFIEVEKGIVFEAVNIGWEYFPLKNEMEKAIGIPTYIDNDANVAALGEMWQGAAKGAKNIICVTLGTGVGCGIIVQGEIMHGHSGMAGEIGHVTTMVENGYLCNCGKRGCLETIASATGIVRMAMEEMEKEECTSILRNTYREKSYITAKDVFDGAKIGDVLATKVVHDALKHLGFALGNLANVINPEMIIIGGGVSKAGSFLIDILRPNFNRYAIPKLREKTEICLAQLGNDAGVVGASWLVSNND